MSRRRVVPRWRSRSERCSAWHVGLGNCYEATPDKMCPQCCASLGYPFNIDRLHREMDGFGIGHAPHLARRVGMHAPVVVFVRLNGWSLGANEVTEALAFKSWADRWSLFARESEGWRLRPISEYLGGVK